MRKISIKKQLMMSCLSLLLCFSMLVGTTFAWFTDSVESLNNKIVAGNLDVVLQYSKDCNTWNDVTSDSNVFDETLWEPGHTEVVYLKISNVGTLALKYNLNINIAHELGSVNVAGEEFELSDYIMYGVVEASEEYTSREDAREAVEEEGIAQNLKTAYAPETSMLYPADNDEGKASEVILAVVVYMPTTVGNEANYMTGKEAPEIDLGISLFATQLEYESDSFGDDYDAEADYVVELGEHATFVTNPIDGMIENNGTVDISGLNMTNDGTGIMNYGNASLKDVTGDITQANRYFAIGEGEKSVIVFENVNATTKGGVIELRDGAKGVFKSGSLTNNSESTSGRHMFYAHDGAKLIIEDGDFTFSPTNLTRKGYYVLATGGSTVIINGGHFDMPSSRPSYKNGFSADATSSIIITGGTFAFDPSKWVAEGYKATKDENGIWTVAFDTAALTDAFADGQFKLYDDLTLENSNITVPAGTEVTLDLNGHTLSAKNTEAKASSAIDNKGTLTIKNGTVTYEGVGDASFGYGTNTITNSGSLVIDGATIINTTNAGSSNAIDNAPGSELIVKDGVIKSEKVTIRLRDGSTATIKGGEITGKRAVQIHLIHNNNQPTSLTIEGGKLVGSELALYSYAYGNSTFAKTTVNISGGVFDGDVAFGGGNKTDRETVSVTGGTFNGELGRYLANDGWEDIVKP